MLPGFGNSSFRERGVFYHLFQLLCQARGIHSGARDMLHMRFVVVQEEKHPTLGWVLSDESIDDFCPFLHLSRSVVTYKLCHRTMQADVHDVCTSVDYWTFTSVFVVRCHQRPLVSSQDVIHFLFEPCLVPELNANVDRLWNGGSDGPNPVEVGRCILKLWWKLHQNSGKAITEGPTTVGEKVVDVSGNIAIHLQ